MPLNTQTDLTVMEARETPTHLQLAPRLLTERVIMDSHPEHREFPRAPIGVPVRYWDWGTARQAEALELSANGLFLKTTQVLGEGARLTVRLELPGRRGMTVLGQVVRTVKGGLLAVAGMGVRFVDLSPSQRELIAEFVAARAVPVPA